MSVVDSFSYMEDFQAKSIFIATWEGVGYYDGGSDKLNTYQVIIISDGEDSFVEFIYPEKGIQWIQGTGSESGLPDARAQAGLVSQDGTMYTLHGSGTDRVYNLEKKSNTFSPGQWIFHVGQVDKIEEPDLYNTSLVAANQLDVLSCTNGGSTQCHSKSKCVDYEHGICCVCNDNFYGNGKSCIKNDVPLRANGKISGFINSLPIENLDLQSYIVMSDGRAYTAISKVPKEIGYNVQVLQILGGVIGFLFAKPIGNVKNGYQLTGGIFNHSATLTFPLSGERITIEQIYLGLDVFDQLRLEVSISGRVPRIPDHEKLELDDFEETFRVTEPGLILSTSRHRYRYGANTEEFEFDIEQTIKYTPCKFAPNLEFPTWKLKVSKNYISYESKEQILRFGMSDKVTTLVEVDPCQEGRLQCGSDSSCIVEGDSFSCVCNVGFHYIYNEDNQARCVDINECQVGLHNCDTNAQCINQPGTFNCRCNPGYEGDGYSCKNTLTCAQLRCAENAQCVYDNEAKCQCIPGYYGDGRICVADKRQSCDIVNNCSPFALCGLDNDSHQYACECLPGYNGNGYICEPSYAKEETTEEVTEREEIETATKEEHIVEKCLFGVCWCPEGFERQPNTRYCIPKEEVTTTMPEEHEEEVTTITPEEHKEEEEETTEHNQKVVSRPVPQCFNNQCFCPLGYNYDLNNQICTAIPGLKLETMGQSGKNLSCNIINTCHPNAQCVFVTQVGTYECHCNAGYEGDGYECVESDISCADAAGICDVEASCVYDEYMKKSICVCNPGFQGDGIFCEVLPQCASNYDCQESEECIYSTDSQRYECICKLGYEKDEENKCRQLKGTCGGGTCVENAECLYDPDYQTHYCQCKQDFIGDGITECNPRPLGCNVINDCGLHASCVFEQAIAMYQCQCDEGYYGDGFICATQKTCHVDPYICDVHASCVLNNDRLHVCQCNDGYTGNGTVCKVNPKYEGNFLLLNQGMATLRVPFEPSPRDMGRPIQIQYYQMAIGLDIDCYEGRVYWSDIAGKAIKSSAYNGTEFKDFITDDIGSPEGLSVDWVSRNIFWTDSSKDTLEVANLDTKLRKVLFSKDLVNPRGIAVHPLRGKIFWSDWDRKAPKIEWANMDGTGREIFLQGDHVYLPNSLAIDWETDELCFADAGTKKIQCIDIETTNIKTIAVNCTYPFGLAITNTHFYWTDWISQKIESVDKLTLHRQPSIKVPLGGSGNKLYGMAAVPEQCPALSNACHFYNGQCKAGHICLPNSSGRRTCVCADKDRCNSVY